MDCLSRALDVAGRRSAPVLVVLCLALDGNVGCAHATDDDVTSGGSAGSTSGGGGGEAGAVSDGGSSSGSAGASSTGGGVAGTSTNAGAAGTADAGSGGSATGGAGAGGGGAGGASGGVGGGSGAGAGGKGGAAGAGGSGNADECPNDPQKVAPGKCGCGVPEVCAELEDGLAHRYSFSSNNMTATDSIGTAHGTIVGVAAAGGKVTFNGTDDAYVNLPNGLISSLTNASFEVWLTWGGGNTWQRIFDFGTNDQGEGNHGTGLSYLYLCPSDGDAGNALRSSFTINGNGNETTARAPSPLATGSVQHLVVVVDDTGNQLRLYLNGTQASSVTYNGSLSGIADVNNWLGRSNWNDAPLKGVLDEFRIYDIALSAAQVTASKNFGPDPTFL